jgi:hypothetical protein
MLHSYRSTKEQPTAPVGRRAVACCILAVLGAVLLFASTGTTQETKPPRPLQVSGFVPGGVRTTVTEGWVKLDFNLTNAADTDRRARVLAFYENQPDKQYGRELWVPAHATVASWFPLGPAPTQAANTTREIQMLVYELAEGKDHLVLPGTEERIRARAVLYRKREPSTGLIVDDFDEGVAFGQFPRLQSPADEALTLARVLRSTRELSEFVQVIYPNTLPAWPKAFDGIDQMILASGKLSKDPAGLQALRQWLEQGGNVWVMLDRVEPEVVTRLLGEAFDFEIVGKVGLTEFRIEKASLEAGAAPAPVQRYEQPVDFVHVLLAAGTSPEYTIDGWPVWFMRTVGRGKILFSTLGPRGWYQPGIWQDRPAPLPNLPKLPVATEALDVAAVELFHAPVQPSYPVEAFEDLLIQEIGYSVVGRGTIALVFGLFLTGILGLTALLRRGSRRPALLGLVGPALAVAAAAAFVALGSLSRQAAPPTVAFAQVVDAVAGTGEASIDGLAAVYHAGSGPANLAAERGAFFDLDLSGVEGQTHRLILTDLDAWHWENVVLPAGIRFAPFQFTARAGEPITAVARFGPKGLEGALSAKTFANLSDGLLTSAGGRNLAVPMGPDGSFTAGTADTLAPGQFLASTLLSDRQQRRQEIYRQFLKRTGASHDRHVLLAWADPALPPFNLAPEARVVGTALLRVPLRLERPAAGTAVTIPAPFVEVNRLVDGRLSRLPRESALAAELHLRFQLPASVLPLQVERARLIGNIDARLRRLTIAAKAGDAFVDYYQADNPFGPIQVDLAEDRFLHLDAEGGLHLRVTLSAIQKGGAFKAQATRTEDQNWTIEYLELEVVGRSGAK